MTEYHGLQFRGSFSRLRLQPREGMEEYTLLRHDPRYRTRSYAKQFIKAFKDRGLRLSRDFTRRLREVMAWPHACFSHHRCLG